LKPIPFPGTPGTGGNTGYNSGYSSGYNPGYNAGYKIIKIPGYLVPGYFKK